MSFKLLSPREGFPRDGWKFSDPLTGKQFEDPYMDLNTLVKQIIGHRLANPKFYAPNNIIGFNFEAIEQEILGQLYAQQPHLFE